MLYILFVTPSIEYLLDLFWRKLLMNCTKEKKSNISHLRVFGCKCFGLNNSKDSLWKFDAKADEAIFLGYSLHSKAYKVFNKRTLNFEEFVHVVCDETNFIVQENSF